MTKEKNTKGPLTGIRVIDFGWYYAGPMAGMMMADQGAEVIRIVKPGDKELPEQQYRVLNRNKKLLELDLKTAEGKAKALELIARADVVIENFRPGVMKRLGLDYASVKAANPRLVYLSLPGFSPTDEKRANIQAWEGVMGAASCLYRETSIFRQKYGYPPVVTWVPQASMYGGMLGMLSVMAALVKREEAGVGTVIEIPMVDATMMILTFKIWMHSIGIESTKTPNPVPDNMKHLLYDENDTPEQTLEKLTEATWDAAGVAVATSRSHYCADGRQILHWTNNIEKFNTRMLKALGIYHKLVEEGFVDYGCWEFGRDNNISDQVSLRKDLRERLAELVKEAFLTRTAEEWDTILGEVGVPTGMFRTRAEWLQLVPMIAAGVLAEMDNGNSKLTTVGRFADVSAPDGSLVEPVFNEAQPLTEERLDAILKGAPVGASSNASGESVTKGNLLQGLKVLDFSNVAAGPIGCATLAQYGADVIKVDPPEFMLGPIGLAISAQYLHGRQAMLIDQASAQTRKVLERLFKWADVIVHNSVDGTAERLGVSFDQINEINPNAVVCQLSAFGGSYRNNGGWEKRNGFDLSLQSASGVMTQFGTMEHPQWHSNVATTDIMGAYSTCVMALLGAYQQRKTGKGSEARTSLARMISYVQLPYMIAENGKSDWDEPRGQFATGWNCHQRIYRCSDDEWVYVGAREADALRLVSLVLGRELKDISDVDEQALEAAFLTQTHVHWERSLQAADLGCHKVMSGEDVFNNFPIRELGLGSFEATNPVSTEVITWPTHPWDLPVTQMAPNFVRIGENRSWYVPEAGCYFGQHTRKILADLGFRDSEIEAMVENKSVHEYLEALGSGEKRHLWHQPQKKAAE